MNTIGLAPSTAMTLHHLRNEEDRRRVEEWRMARRARVPSMPVTDPHEPTTRPWMRSLSAPRTAAQV